MYRDVLVYWKQFYFSWTAQKETPKIFPTSMIPERKCWLTWYESIWITSENHASLILSTSSGKITRNEYSHCWFDWFVILNKILQRNDRRSIDTLAPPASPTSIFELNLQPKFTDSTDRRSRLQFASNVKFLWISDPVLTRNELDQRNWQNDWNIITFKDKNAQQNTLKAKWT